MIYQKKVLKLMANPIMFKCENVKDSNRLNIFLKKI